ncbi:SprB repeat-containing protein, partial [Aureispira]|nr:SprB repeat-containing protein [Aureispira sp.]
MKNLFLLILIISQTNVLFAQEISRHVVASGGNYSTSTNISVSATIGEPVVNTLTSSGLILTQGFQQPSITSGINGCIDSTACNYDPLATTDDGTCNYGPAQPTLACYETAAFNTTTCVWDVSGTQPTAPTGLACYESSAWNGTTCVWDVSGTQPTAPTGLACYESSAWNGTTCVWDVSGTQPTAPTGLACYESSAWNGTTCVWDVTGTAPTASTVSVDASSVGASDGTATVNALGGTSPYSYLWSDGQTTATAIGLAAGTYTVTVTDGNGCAVTASVTVNASGPIGSYVTAQDGSWSTGSTWVGGNVPPSSADVTIDHHVMVGSNMTHTGSMTISLNNSVTMGTGSDLSHSGALDNNGNILGSFTLTGSSRAINIGAVEDLAVAVTGTVSANANCSISRLLRVDAGATIDVTGHEAVLLADASRTALVHDNGGVTLGDFTVEQYIPEAGNPYANIFYASPINNATVGQIQDDCIMLLTGNANSFYYDETTGQWTTPTSFAYPMANGEGFYQYAYVPNAGIEFDFTGELNTGNISIPISNTNGGGWNIIGNPYPSPIDLQSLWGVGANPAVYYRYNGNTYNSFIAPIGLSNPPGLTANVPIMQGFWVNAGTFSTVNFDNNVRISDPAASVDDFTKSSLPVFRLAMAYQTDIVNSAVYFFNA